MFLDLLTDIGKGPSGSVLDYAVKRFKSHRTIPKSLHELQCEYDKLHGNKTNRK